MAKTKKKTIKLDNNKGRLRFEFENNNDDVVIINVFDNEASIITEIKNRSEYNIDLIKTEIKYILIKLINEGIE